MEWFQLEMRGNEKAIRAFVAMMVRSNFVDNLTLRSLPNSEDVICKADVLPDGDSDLCDIPRKEFLKWVNYRPTEQD